MQATVSNLHPGIFKIDNLGLSFFRFCNQISVTSHKDLSCQQLVETSLFHPGIFISAHPGIFAVGNLGLSLFRFCNQISLTSHKDLSCNRVSLCQRVKRYEKVTVVTAIG